MKRSSIFFLFFFTLTQAVSALAKPLDKENLIRFTRAEYRGRIEQSVDLTDDGKALFIVCNMHKQQDGTQDSGKIYYFNPLLGQPKSVLDVEDKCHKSQVYWANENNKFYLKPKSSIGFRLPQRYLSHPVIR